MWQHSAVGNSGTPQAPGVSGGGFHSGGPGLKATLSEKPGVHNPGGLAAAIGRRIAAKGGK